MIMGIQQSFRHAGSAIRLWSQRLPSCLASHTFVSQGSKLHAVIKVTFRALGISPHTLVQYLRSWPGLQFTLVSWCNSLMQTVKDIQNITTPEQLRSLERRLSTWRPELAPSSRSASGSSRYFRGIDLSTSPFTSMARRLEGELSTKTPLRHTRIMAVL